MNRSRSGLIIRSSWETTAELGFSDQAATVVLAEKLSAVIGAWEIAMNSASGFGTSEAKSAGKDSGFSCTKPPPTDTTLFDAGGVLACKPPAVSPTSG